MKEEGKKEQVKWILVLSSVECAHFRLQSLFVNNFRSALQIEENQYRCTRQLHSLVCVTLRQRAKIFRYRRLSGTASWSTKTERTGAVQFCGWSSGRMLRQSLSVAAYVRTVRKHFAYYKLGTIFTELSLVSDVFYCPIDFCKKKLQHCDVLPSALTNSFSVRDVLRLMALCLMELANKTRLPKEKKKQPMQIHHRGWNLCEAKLY